MILQIWYNIIGKAHKYSAFAELRCYYMIKRKNAIIKFVSAAVACATLISSAVIPASAAHNYREVRSYSRRTAMHNVTLGASIAFAF